VSFEASPDVEKRITEHVLANTLTANGTQLYDDARSAMEHCFRGDDFSQELR
jgi:hypothetical protein